MSSPEVQSMDAWEVVEGATTVALSAGAIVLSVILFRVMIDLWTNGDAGIRRHREQRAARGGMSAVVRDGRIHFRKY